MWPSARRKIINLTFTKQLEEGEMWSFGVKWDQCDKGCAAGVSVCKQAEDRFKRSMKCEEKAAQL